jgi:GT2 family glycosyltransferase
MKYDLISADGPSCEQIGYATFVGLLVRAGAIRTAGLPKQGYFIRADDNEYVLRLSRAGRVYLIRDSQIVHHDASASKKVAKTLMGRMVNQRPIRSYWRKYYGLRNKLLIVRAHAQTPLEKWYGYAMGFKNLARGALAVVVFDDCKLLRLKVLFLAFKHGLIGKSGKCIDPDDFLKERVEVR